MPSVGRQGRQGRPPARRHRRPWARPLDGRYSRPQSQRRSVVSSHEPRAPQRSDRERPAVARSRSQGLGPRPQNARGNLGEAHIRLRLGKASWHEVDHGQVNHGFTGLGPVFVMSAQATIVRQPGEGSQPASEDSATSSNVPSPRFKHVKLGHMALATYRSVRPSSFKSAVTTPRPRPSVRANPALSVTSVRDVRPVVAQEDVLVASRERILVTAATVSPTSCDCFRRFRL
jgi:hypothetical protein